MAQIVSDLENNHIGRKLATMATTLGSLIEIFQLIIFLSFFIGNPMQILIFLLAMLALSLGRLWSFQPCVLLMKNTVT